MCVCVCVEALLFVCTQTNKVMPNEIGKGLHNEAECANVMFYDVM